MANYDTSDPLSIVRFVQDQGANLDLGNLQQQIENAIRTKVTEALTEAVSQIAGKLAPGFGALRSLYQGLSWLIKNAPQLQGLLDTVAQSIPDLARYDAGAFQAKLVSAFEKLVPLGLGFAAAQLGLQALPCEHSKGGGLYSQKGR